MQSSAISSHSQLLALQAALAGQASSASSAGQFFPTGSASSASPGAAATVQGSSPASQFASDALSALISYQTNPVAAASSAVSAAGDAATMASNVLQSVASRLGSLFTGHHDHQQSAPATVATTA